MIMRSSNLTGGITNITAEENNQRLPLRYVGEIRTLIKDFGIKDDYFIKYLKDLEAEVNTIKTKFGQDIKDHNYYNVLEYLGYEPKLLEDKMLEIKQYSLPDNFTFADIGIDENELLKHIKGIRKNLNLQYSNATSLGNIRYINGDAILETSKIKDLGELEYARYLSLKKEIPGNVKQIGELGINGVYTYPIPNLLKGEN